jgi:hypothetical protein
VLAAERAEPGAIALNELVETMAERLAASPPTGRPTCASTRLAEATGSAYLVAR